LLVGGIGIMNIMLVSVTERTREIGLRKAIGASSGTVLSQFLIEAIVLSMLGGGIGIAAAVALANVAGKLAKITPVFTPGSIGLAFGVSAAVGIIFGIAPAIKAARKRPIQALKAE
jgi:putative ABC transport system permease protein